MFRRVIGMLGLVAWLTGAAQADPRFCDRPVRVALFEYGVLYRSDTGDGIDPRLLEALAKRTGCQYEFVVLPRARIWTELERGSLDLATAAIPTPERRRFGYMLPYFRTRNLALLRDAPGSPWRSMQAFEASSGKVGVVRGFRHEAAVDEFLAHVRSQERVVESADVQENLRLLQSGIVDLVFAQPVVFRSYLGDAEMAALRFLDWVPKDQESVGAFILSRKSFRPEQAQAWDQLLSKMIKDGTVGKIYGHFLPADMARESVFRGERPTDF
ncbi:transporter substrate-binding domain-containing protein [Curvibacter sp. APW13]|uniref:substrate-binding periplasmic protein n=1 Tax=Curvibacter sp. APW13 TaxID=3077236 RepID=UPI0028DFBE8E|nr:transporter substrate-binding domain-containing protein [Curvibacter sp. APW13]MDT8990335.1 transporter substrate-binding domain-containing protein [Curvibacter sp. APW13]